MSTNSTTSFQDGFTRATIYRHWDGYPEGAGVDLLRFLEEVSKLRDTRFDDPSYLAAKYVVFLADEFRAPGAHALDFISVGVYPAEAREEFHYEVDCSARDARGLPVVRCFGPTGPVPIPGVST